MENEGERRRAPYSPVTVVLSRERSVQRGAGDPLSIDPWRSVGLTLRYNIAPRWINTKTGRHADRLTDVNMSICHLRIASVLKERNKENMKKEDSKMRTMKMERK